jgi:hypothetical protein
MKELDKSGYGPVTLGALIDALELVKHDDEGKPRHVRFDFGALLPNMRVNSYRGFYSEAAIGFENYSERYKRLGHGHTPEDYPNVVELLTALKCALDAQMTGYKGGEYTMHRDVAVFVAGYGDATQCGITGLNIEDRWQVVLETAYFSV